MSYLVRRISKGKWPSEEDINSDESNNLIQLVKADAITACLKTHENTLSTWVVENVDEESLKKAVIALFTNNKQTKLNKVDIVYFPTNMLEEKNLELEDYPGDTVVKEYVDSHKNISNLSYDKLGKFGEIILDCLKSERHILMNEKKVKRIILEAIDRNIIKPKDLHLEMQEYLKLDKILNTLGVEMIRNASGEFVEKK